MPKQPTKTAGKQQMVARLVALGVPLFGSLIVAIWGLTYSPLQAAQPEQPISGVVESAQRSKETSTKITVTPALKIRVTLLSSGTITRINIASGKPIQTGDTVVDVDGRPITAYRSEFPLYRDISAEMSGPDVTIAQKLLASLGYSPDTNGRVAARTRTAIRAFNAAHGHNDDSTLRRSTLVWIPLKGAAPTAIAITLGQSVQDQTTVYETTTTPPTIEIDAQPAPTDRRLLVSGIAVTVPAHAKVIESEPDIDKLIAVLNGAEHAEATIEELAPTTVGAIPATAVIADQGKICFFPNETGNAIIIEGALGAYGLVDVPAHLIGTPVLINPRSVRTRLSCGS